MITGSNGFIGHKLVEKLSDHHKVIAITRSETALAENNDNIYFMCCDLRNCEPSIFDDVDIVVHAAGTPNSDDCFEKNCLLTQKFVETLSISNNQPMFVFLSSYAVYGNRDSPAKETDILSPDDDYALSKILCENIVKFYSKKFGFRSIIIRLGSVYGPGGSGIVDKLRDSLHENNPISVSGLSQARTFIYINDVCEAIRQLIERPANSGVNIFNLGSDDTITISDLLDNFKQSSLIKINNFGGPYVSYRLDNKKIKDTLNINFVHLDTYLNDLKIGPHLVRT